MALFQKGQGGRAKGSRNKLSMSFVEALAKEFDEFGAEAIRLMRIEHPADFIKIIAAIMPKEFEISDSRMKDLTDEQIATLIRFTAGSDPDSAGSIDSGAETTTH